MLKHELLRDDGILVLKPGGALEASDFERVARELDPYIEERGDLRGLLIEAESFPGWSDFAAFISHLRFIRDHHQHTPRWQRFPTAHFFPSPRALPVTS